MVLGDNQYYYISLCEDLDTIRLIMTPDESGIITDAGLEERRKLLKHFRKSLFTIAKSLSKLPEDIQKPIALIPCPQCNGLHLQLDLVCNAKRSVRCITKLPPDYYSDLAEKGSIIFIMSLVTYVVLLVNQIV